MKISKYTGGIVQTNGYLVETVGGNFLVDAPAGVSAWLDSKGIRLDHLYLTHQHYDHVEDVSELQKKGVKIHAWAPYSKELTLESYGSSWGLPEVSDFTIDELVPEGERELFGVKTKVAHVPGHSLDSITFYVESEGIVFAGDALFAGSVGRCDLPGGDFEVLLSGISRELLTLPDETKVFSGHGPETTIGHERVSNGYLR
ncbi:MBL fold metallo-hydrolase [Luteolibacter algae]|uniref:MBL fold metallo-hydrolase n=1 Tax=Luteolibacter algae TaxID=454151 RepID=A0ABW5D7T0_9BACT